MDIPTYIKNSIQQVEGDAKIWIDEFLQRLSTNANILEVGSGTGRDANYIEKKGYIVIRTDIYPEFIEYQNEKYKKKVLFFDLKQEIIPDNFLKKFDGLFVRSVLNHFSFEEIKEILRRLKLVLKSNALFAFNLPNNIFSQKIIDYLKQENFNLISLNISHKDGWVYIIVSSPYPQTSL
ncbi:MAG: class I SAM-dependent methyltransferase [Candidatus Paceibacterota bacterium]|jgi:SAM-dependent methyltransferase